MELRKEFLTRCPLCGSDQVVERLKARDFNTQSGIYSIFHCSSCDVRFTNPRPLAEDLPKIYKVRQSGMDMSDRSILSLKLRQLKLRGYIKRLAGQIGKRDYSILDYGCGDGLVALGFAKRPGCRQAWAVDIADDPPPLLRQYRDSKIRYLSIQQLSAERERFDLIILRHVLEHCPEPRKKIVELVRNLLKPGGTIHFEVPNIESIWARIFRSYYTQLGVPQHLIHFSKRSIRRSFPAADIHSVSIPVLGQSLALLLNRKISNIGLLAAIFYGPQLLIDLLIGNTNAFLVKLSADDQ